MPPTLSREENHEFRGKISSFDSGKSFLWANFDNNLETSGELVGAIDHPRYWRTLDNTLLRDITWMDVRQLRGLLETTSLCEHAERAQQVTSACFSRLILLNIKKPYLPPTTHWSSSGDLDANWSVISCERVFALIFIQIALIIRSIFTRSK